MNQKSINLKKKLREGKLTFGSWITIGHTIIAEIMAQKKFEWLVIDLEHSVIDLQKAQELIQIIDLEGKIPLVRLTENDPSLIKRVMDAGAHGIIVPMVKTKEDALKAVKSVKYPPLGIRSVGLARAQGYGERFDSYKLWVNKNSIIIVQIEHVDAVNNIDEIFSIKEIDGYIIGPYDLSASLGIPGDLNNKKVLDVEKIIMNSAKKYGKIAGIHSVQPDARSALSKINLGYKFIAIGTDFLFLGNSCKNILQEIEMRLKH